MKSSQNNNQIDYERIQYDQLDFPVNYHLDTMGGEHSLRGLANWHEEIEVLLFLEGEGTIYSCLEPHPVKAGDIVILFPYCLHRVANITSICRYYCLLVNPSFINFSSSDSSLDMLISNDPAIHGNVERIIGELEERRDGYKTVVYGEMNALIGRFSRQNGTFRQNANHLDPQLDAMRKVLRYININYAQKITVSDMCSLVNLSRSYFSQCFTATTGCPFLIYLNRLRCEKAYHLIASTSMSITECAFECGFQNKSYFTRKFQEIYHMLPSEVRAAHRRAAEN